jgi:quercetin dioxygenase-like cupin family protein
VGGERIIEKVFYIYYKNYAGDCCMSNLDFFPEIITKLPEADIPVDGLHSFLFQGEQKQMIFMAFDKDAEIPAHSHEGQWAVVLDGQIELTIGSETFNFRKGDTYFIPRNVTHSARVKAGYKDLTLFDQKDRYQIKAEPKL